ncbi:TATA box-binding-like protein 1 [Armadillidium nasatum]|uniref:TATA box-binding protein-like 1 n=1 Tax=Armadillidium nasatum TaxID=96803 RepID=A0A5N5TKL9_9CRUS|nr:TATA box-binding-like protein 1 [Armadillidium nasatum]
MANSHTVMPGIYYTNATVLNVANTASGISANNQQGIAFPISHPTVNGTISLNGHNNTLITTTNGIHRPVNRITIQGTSNNATYLAPISNNIIFNSNSSSYQIGSNGILERIPGHNLNILTNSALSTTALSSTSTSSTECHVNKQINSNVEVVGLSEVAEQKYTLDEVKEERKEIKKDIMKKEPQEEEEEEEPVIDIMINNVVCSFSVGCHLNLRNIALTGKNVEFRKENGMVTLKLRRPLTTASIWSSGKITCTGSTSEDQARIAARRVARSLQKLGYNVKFRNYRIVNVLGTCTMPFAIKISQFSQNHRHSASYEPELHPGVTYRIEHPKATLKIFSTGSITVTAPSVANVQSAIETIYPLVKEFSKRRSPEEDQELKKNQMKNTVVESEESDGDV